MNASGHGGRWCPSFQFFQLHRETVKTTESFSSVAATPHSARYGSPLVGACHQPPPIRADARNRRQEKEGSRCRRRRGVGEARRSVDPPGLVTSGLAPPAPCVRAQPELRAVAVSVAGTFGLLPAWPLRCYPVSRLEERERRWATACWSGGEGWM
jgi:hypothetical protein